MRIYTRKCVCIACFLLLIFMSYYQHVYYAAVWRLRNSGNTKLANSKFVNFIDLVSKAPATGALNPKP